MRKWLKKHKTKEVVDGSFGSGKVSDEYKIPAAENLLAYAVPFHTWAF